MTRQYTYQKRRIASVERRIRHYRWLIRRKIELFSVAHFILELVMSLLGLEVPQ